MSVENIKEFINNSLDKVMNTRQVRQKNKILISILKKVVSMLDNLELKDNDWTDTRIKTPRNTRKVIATTTDGFVGEMNYDPETKEWYYNGDEVFEGVIGWKEKPKPYKRKE